MEIHRGDLVANSVTGEYGIVLEEERNTYLIMMGDGLTIEKEKYLEEWAPVPFGWANLINANFVELLPVPRISDDWRDKIQHIQDVNDRLLNDVKNLKIEVEKMMGAPEAVREILKGNA